MRLADFENDVLLMLQQPGAAFPNPNFVALTNPQFSQQIVDFYINQGYARTLSDLADYDLTLVTASFGSQAYNGVYPFAQNGFGGVTDLTSTIPLGVPAPGLQAVAPASMTNVIVGSYLNVGGFQAAGSEYVAVTAVTATTFTARFLYAHGAAAPIYQAVFPNIRQVRRCYYAPQGLGYTQEYMPGGDLIDWDEFQSYTDQGYLTSTSYATQPGKMAVTPDRKSLAMYSAPYLSGDIITVQYAPIPTPGADFCPTLVNQTDVSVLPEDCNEAVVQWALSRLWLRERQAGAASYSKSAYTDEINRIRDEYRRSSSGSSLRIREKGLSGILGGLGGLSVIN